MGQKNLQYLDKNRGKKHSGGLVEIKQNFKVINCRPCGFKHVIPNPSDEELKKLYGENFYTHEKPNYYKYVEEDLNWWMMTYRNYYRLFEKYTRGRRLLDIGSGPGYFLKCGKDMGWDVVGVEPSLSAYKYSSKLGVKVINGFLAMTNLRKLDHLMWCI